MWDIRAGFAFEDDTAGFEGFEFVPYVLGDVNAVDAVFLAEDDTVNYRAVIIIGRRAHFAS